MKLTKVNIKNFRSLDELDFSFSPLCRVLVGINESGKSNILKALAMLDNDKSPSAPDIREANTAEGVIEEALVKFVFEFEKIDLEEIYKNIYQNFIGLTKKEEVVKDQNKNFSLKNFCGRFNKGVYHVDVIKREKNGRYYSAEGFEVLDNWKKPSKQCPADFAVKISEEKPVNLNTIKFINVDEYKEIPPEYLESLTIKDLNAFIGSQVCEYIENNLPEVLLWEYDEKNILPPKININKFKENADICLPLKYMFHLAGIVDIKANIENSQQTEKGFKNLLNRIATKSTSHLHSVWKEYKEVQFELVPNGENIDASIKDTFNSFDFAQRSDGFKRFVSFLLMVSTKVKSDLLNNALLLIDEPDLGLHPSGARFLRDELIKISDNNYVVYSTHSIFMIDRKHIERHLIVEKEKEITQTKVANESNIVKEEVIYNALGFSFFESLKEKNILFEGWRDEKLFEKAMEKVPSKYASLKESFKEVGTCFGDGVKSMAHLTPLLKLAARATWIISDSDTPAKNKKKEYEKNHGYGSWKTYEDIDSELKVVTGEDFVKTDVILKILLKLKEDKAFTVNIVETDFVNPKGKLYVINKWLTDNGIQDNKIREEMINSVKQSIFDDLKNSQIEEYYYDFLAKVISCINTNL